MTAMPQEVQDLFMQVSDVVFATADANGQPNASIVGMKWIVDDETIYLSDQFFNKTLANVKANDKVSVVFWHERVAFQIYGTARYVNDGPTFEEQKARADALFQQKDLPISAKGGVYVHVSAVFTSVAGPTAGDRIA